MSLRIAAIQHDIIWEDSAANFARLTPQIERAVSAGGRLVVLSEMFSTGFTMNSLNCAEPLEGPSFHFLSEAATNHQVGVVGSIPTRWEDGIAYNTLTLVAPDGQVHR